MEWYIKVLKNYVNFEGRARRKEFWMFTLINSLIILGLYALIFAIIFSTALSMDDPANAQIEDVPNWMPILSLFLYGIAVLYSLAVFLPSLAVAVRRLHDTGRSGWMYLIGLIPLVGTIILIVFFATDGDHGDNEYGPDPKAFVEGDLDSMTV